MRRSSVQWILAILITLASVVWQRATGPTYPARGSVDLAGQEVRLRLARSNPTSGRQPVVVSVPDQAVTGEVEWRRYPTSDAWQVEPMRRTGSELRAELPPPPLPLMPPAGKLEFRVKLQKEGAAAAFPPEPAVTRFRSDVSAGILVPHILAMFVGMLLSTKAGLAALAGTRFRGTGVAALSLLVLGGMVFGPMVQKQAFDAYWTGLPWGWDLTDNKTLIAVVAWAIAVWRIWKTRGARAAVVLAALATLVVFAIPHSVWGSEVKWE